MNENLERILIDEKTLKARIAEMGAQISRDYAGEELVVIGLLKGAAYFLTELTQHITVPVRIDFIKASSYGSGTTTSGKVDIDYDTSRNIAGKNVLLVDDVIDTGLTLKAVGELFRNRNPKSLKVAAMLDKKERRLVKVLPDDAEETARVFDLLLGDNLSGRKEYIAENGHKYMDMIDVS